ncbi:MAG: fumarylacetoacetate hydrolase family protein [Desulfobacteraceae bacterium]|nr:fumarylacetoacetate hydrolase family protein [Desulfobacteraceae bacterium]
MKIVRFIDSQGSICTGADPENGRAGVVEQAANGTYVPTGQTAQIAQYLPPVDPPAVLCIGLNYRRHAEETGQELPSFPVLFMKNPASVIGHEQNIVLPESCRKREQADYEAELAVVIGKAAKNVSAEEALSYVKGYTIGNDVSARWWQRHAGSGQWVRGKSFDTFCPVGPVMVTADEIPDPGNLEISCSLNSQIMQQSNTSDMIFSVAQIIEYLSEDTTLLPDTVILTGTPSGVGVARKPRVFLKPGDRIEMSIEKIGTLANTVV